MRALFLFFQLLSFDLFCAIKFFPDPNTNTITNNGISIKINPSNVNKTSTKWIVDPISPSSYDISLHLSNQYGFKTSTASTISIEIDGFTPNDSRIGGEILILFSTNNYQYFSVVINLDDNRPWKSYPNHQSDPLATNTDIFTNIINSNNTRWNRISNNNQWTNIGGTTPYTRDLRWPLNINITNDPIKNKLYYKCIEPKNTLIEATFDTTFDTNKGIDIYIMNNEIGTNKPFYIYSFEIISSNPTSTATIFPAISPTLQPSVSPTAQTTTSEPSVAPTWQPIMSKTTFQPSKSPMLQPSLSPTIAVTFDSAIAKPTDNEAEITEFVMNSTIEQGVFQSNKIASYLLIYTVIAGVALLCFISGIVIGVVVYRNKINDNKVQHKCVPSMDINNDESEFKFNTYINHELTQQQNEIQIELNRIMSGNDGENNDNEKLIIEDDVTNVNIRNRLAEDNNNNEVVDKIPTIESIHGHVVNTKRKSSHFEGNGYINNGNTDFVDR